MNTLDPRAEARNRANRRLRRMTLGTAALGMASVGLLGATAAFTNGGTQTSADTVALVASGDAGSTTSRDTAAASSTTSPTSTTAPNVTSTSGAAHASTGGS